MAERGENPFSDTDFKHLLELEKEDTSTAGWTEAKRTRDANVWRKKYPDRDIHLLKGSLRCPGVPAPDADELLSNLEMRQKWDTQFYIIKVLEESSDYKTIYWAMKFPFPLSNRDMIQHCKIVRDEDKIMTLYKHASHPDAPPVHGIVRAETIYSGTIIRPDPDDAQSSQISMVFQADLKGLIPAVAINYLSASVTVQWVQQLVKYHREVYSKEKA